MPDTRVDPVAAGPVTAAGGETPMGAGTLASCGAGTTGAKSTAGVQPAAPAGKLMVGTWAGAGRKLKRGYPVAPTPTAAEVGGKVRRKEGATANCGFKMVGIRLCLGKEPLGQAITGIPADCWALLPGVAPGPVIGRKMRGAAELSVVTGTYGSGAHANVDALGGEAAGGPGIRLGRMFAGLPSNTPLSRPELGATAFAALLPAASMAAAVEGAGMTLDGGVGKANEGMGDCWGTSGAGAVAWAGPSKSSKPNSAVKLIPVMVSCGTGPGLVAGAAGSPTSDCGRASTTGLEGCMGIRLALLDARLEGGPPEITPGIPLKAEGSYRV